LIVNYELFFQPPIATCTWFRSVHEQKHFLTGKAGTGKTTFLHNLKQTLPKRMIVVAPTGVAAINAGGVTIHSFFQLSFAPYIPNARSEGTNSGREDGDSSNNFRKNLTVIKEISSAASTCW